MNQFIVVIVLSHVVYLISRSSLLYLMDKHKTDDELSKSKLYHLFVTLMIVGYGMFWINLSVLIAYMFKTFFL